MFVEVVAPACVFLMCLGFAFAMWNAKFDQEFITIVTRKFESIDQYMNDESWPNQVDADIASLKESHRNLSDWCEIWKNEIELLKATHKKETDDLKARLSSLSQEVGELFLSSKHPVEIVKRHEIDLECKEGVSKILTLIIDAAKSGALSVESKKKPCDKSGCGNVTGIAGVVKS